MSKEDFIPLYEAWSDKVLLKEYRSLEDFEVDERDAIKEILGQRGLANELDKIDQIEIESKMLEQEECLTEYFSSKFGTTLDDVSYAESVKNLNGEYFNKIILGEKKSELHGLFFGAFIAFFILGIVFFLFEFSIYVYMTPLFLLTAIASLWYGNALVKKNKSFFLLKESIRGPVITIRSENETIRFSEAFNYICFAKMILESIDGIQLNRPVLFILLKNEDEFGRDVLLQENQAIKKKIPPNWNMSHLGQADLAHDIAFTQYRNTPIELEKLKRILDGLSIKE